MKRQLLDVILNSEKRKKVLLLLKDGPHEMDTLLVSLDTTRQALLPQVRNLEEHHLVFHYQDTYELTVIGKLIVNEMLPLLNITEVLDTDIEYWGTHNLSFIPHSLLKRIDELKQCKSIDVPLHEIFSENKEFTETSKKSKSVFTVSSYAFPNFEKTLQELIANNISISIIVSRALSEKLFSEHFATIQELIKVPNISLYRYPEDFDFLQVSVNDYSLFLELLTNEGCCDNKKIVCSSNSAVEWGRDLFDHYLKNSIPITEI